MSTLSIDCNIKPRNCPRFAEQRRRQALTKHVHGSRAYKGQHEQLDGHNRDA